MTSQVLTRVQNLRHVEETKVPSAGGKVALSCRASTRSIFSQDPGATMSNMDLISGSKCVPPNPEIKNVMS